MFGEEVKLTFNGEDKLKTVFGGIVTLLALGVVGAFLVFELSFLVNKQRDSFSATSTFSDALTDDDLVTLREEDMQIVFSLTDYTDD